MVSQKIPQPTIEKTKKKNLGKLVKGNHFPSLGAPTSSRMIYGRREKTFRSIYHLLSHAKIS